MELYEEVNKNFGTDYKGNKYIDWRFISTSPKIDPELFNKYKSHLWPNLVAGCLNKIPVDYLEPGEIDIEYLIMGEKLSSSRIQRLIEEETIEDLNWEIISKTKYLDQWFFDEFPEYIDWKEVSVFHSLRDWSFLIKYRDLLMPDFLQYNLDFNDEIMILLKCEVERLGIDQIKEYIWKPTKK